MLISAKAKLVKNIKVIAINFFISETHD